MSSMFRWLRVFGLDMRRIPGACRGLFRYLRTRRQFRAGASKDFRWGRPFPILHEWNETSGGLGAYFHQDLFVAKFIHRSRPRRHVDVGSRIDGLIGHLAVFREVEVLDIRPQPASVHGVIFHPLDLMAELPTEWIECTDSLSCLHTIEHFGLGRYGDAIDPEGHLKGLAQLKRMVAPGGVLYLSTPIGPQRVEFNAHRIFAARTLIDWFSNGWMIEKFAVIDDNNQLHENVDWQGPDLASHFGCRTGVGIVVARRTE